MSKNNKTQVSETENMFDNENLSDNISANSEVDSDAESQITDFSCDYDEIVDGEEDGDIFELEDNYDMDKIKRGDDRISLNRMSRYEMVRILGERVKQLTLGAKCLIKNKEDFDYETLAMEELKLGLIPFKIIRTLPNNVKEEWSIDELTIKHLFR